MMIMMTRTRQHFYIVLFVRDGGIGRPQERLFSRADQYWRMEYPW